MSLHSQVDPSLWVSFITAIVVLIVLDLVVFHRKQKEVKFKEALFWSGFWVFIALLFSAWFAFRYGQVLGTEFLTGYLVELSLSVDNLFVMLLIFKAFSVPNRFQHRVLFWGILGAIVFRGVLIILGVDLIHKFDWIMYVFGGILVYSGAKLVFESDEKSDVSDSAIVRIFKKFVPMTNTIESEKFIVRHEGRNFATPLLLVLCLIEISDVVFAVDSIPAVLSITKDGFVAFGSNIMAILGLRALFFVIADLVANVRYLKPGLAAILCFVGAKMLIMKWYHIPSWVSLTVIVMILITSGLTSWYVTKKSILK